MKGDSITNQTEIAQPGLGNNTHKRLYFVNVIGFEILTILLASSKNISIHEIINITFLLLFSSFFLKIRVIPTINTIQIINVIICKNSHCPFTLGLLKSLPYSHCIKLIITPSYI